MNEIEKLILKKCDNYRQQLISNIQAICRIPSIKSSPELEAPYGRSIKEALVSSLLLSQMLGFSTKNIENRIGYAQYGDSKEYVGVMGHLDVVDVSDGWAVDPFGGVIMDQKIVARGVLDNKGPIYTNLFAMKVLKEICDEHHIQLKRSVRIIFGCDEESGFSDVDFYLNNEELPVYGYTPDCKYPPVYSERGRLKVVLKTKKENASDLFNFVNEYFLAANSTGDRLGIAIYQKEFGNLEMRGYHLFEEAENIGFQFVISYPPETNQAIIIEAIQNRFGNKQIELQVDQNWLPVFFEKDQPFIKIMSEVYEEITGLDGTPVTTTGGTYAKLVPNIIPFGPSFPGQKGIAHQPNEYWDLKDIYLNFEIYAITLYRLAMMD